MLYYIQTWWRWFRRCGLSRGFGVQSPSAYAFIRYVINEHYPYYAYAELKQRLHSLSKLQHKFGRLLLRLSNFWQPEIFYSNIALYDPYIHAGCQKAKSYSLGQVSETKEKKLIVVDLISYDMKQLNTSILPLCHENTLLVLLGLNKLKEKKLWYDLQNSSFTGITYNLYYAGIVFFDHTVYKQHYDVNY